MKARPIILSAPMVRALLDGRKTQTRRVVKPQPPAEPTKVSGKRWGFVDGGLYYYGVRCPYGQPGDLLWVRETHGPLTLVVRDGELSEKVFYRATDEQPRDHRGELIRWRPSIHMPRWASRLTLELTAVGVERLQEISRDDATAEGFEKVPALPIDPRDWYRNLWDTLNAKRGFSWESNPWVWVLTFKMHKAHVDDVLKATGAAP